MSSIRWSALFLSLAAPLACAPHYDVGDGDAAAGSGGDGVGGSATTGGTGGSGGTGGKGTPGGGGTDGSGGSSTTGGSGGSGEAGGSDAGGSDPSGGTGGSSMAGAAGGGMMPPVPVPSCGEPAEHEYASLAEPTAVWERISRFLFGEVRDAPSALPEVTTPEWAVDILRDALAMSRLTSASGRQALIPFMQKFLDAEPAGAVGDPPHEYWARTIGAAEGRLGVLFEGDENSNPPFGLFGTVAAQYEGISQRGGFLSSRLFCVAIELSPVDIPPLMVGPNETRREALSAGLSDPSCAGCHSILDPLAFPLEVLTPGTLEYRTTENGLPIDTSGSYSGLEFSDIESLGEQLSVSCEVARCFTDQLFIEAVPGDDLGVSSQAQRGNALYRFAAPDLPEAEQFQFQALLEAIVSSPAFLE